MFTHLGLSVFKHFLRHLETFLTLTDTKAITQLSKEKLLTFDTHTRHGITFRSLHRRVRVNLRIRLTNHVL